MAAWIRALIIAVEHYPGAQEVGTELAGTLDSALAFAGWLTASKGVAAADIFFCASGPCPGRRFDASKAGVRQALEELYEAGRNATAELYVYCSGHGLSRWGPVAMMDLLLCQEFVKARTSGDACLDLQELRAKLRAALGPGEHYHFIDACRTQVSGQECQPTALGQAPASSELGVASTYALYSARPGATAPASGGFPQALLGALCGAGRAKRWRSGAYWVTFDGICEYLPRRLGDRTFPYDTSVVDRESHRGQILRLSQVGPSRCEVQVQDGTPQDVFELKVSDAHGREQPGPPSTFTGSTVSFDVTPDDYVLEISLGRGALTRVAPAGPAEVDLYESRAVVFSKAPPQTDVVRSDELAAGPIAWRRGPAHRALLDAVRLHGHATLETTLPRLGSEDLGLWLTVAGAAGLLDAHDRLRGLGLPSMRAWDDGSAHVLLLARLRRPGSPVVDGTPLQASAADVYQAHLVREPGPQLLRINVPGWLRAALPTHARPGHVTLIVLCEDPLGRPQVDQQIIPMALPASGLDRVRESAQALRRFATGQEQDPAELRWHAQASKGTDPVLVLVGLYSLLRRGQREEARWWLALLQAEWPDLPDLRAAGLLLHTAVPLSDAPPLFLDGLMALGGDSAAPELPAAYRLDYTGPFTLWLAPQDADGTRGT